MTKEENKVRLIFSDLCNEKNKIDSLLAEAMDNYYSSKEKGEDYLLFWIRDREIDKLKLSVEKLFTRLNDLVNMKKKIMGTKI